MSWRCYAENNHGVSNLESGDKSPITSNPSPSAKFGDSRRPLPLDCGRITIRKLRPGLHPQHGSVLPDAVVFTKARLTEVPIWVSVMVNTWRLGGSYFPKAGFCDGGPNSFCWDTTEFLILVDRPSQKA